jgi:hypothetical protein
MRACSTVNFGKNQPILEKWNQGFLLTPFVEMTWPGWFLYTVEKKIPNAISLVSQGKRIGKNQPILEKWNQGFLLTPFVEMTWSGWFLYTEELGCSQAAKPPVNTPNPILVKALIS